MDQIDWYFGNSCRLFAGNSTRSPLFLIAGLATALVSGIDFTDDFLSMLGRHL